VIDLALAAHVADAVLFVDSSHPGDGNVANSVRVTGHADVGGRDAGNVSPGVSAGSDTRSLGHVRPQHPMQRN